MAVSGTVAVQTAYYAARGAAVVESARFLRPAGLFALGQLRYGVFVF